MDAPDELTCARCGGSGREPLPGGQRIGAPACFLCAGSGVREHPMVQTLAAAIASTRSGNDGVLGTTSDFAAARAVLAVPAIADALRAAERDAKVAEIVAEKPATDPPDRLIKGCNCASYNNPEKVRPTVSGPVPEVVLTPPPELGIERETVCVDACISTVVQHLWDCGVVTLGSCCGHGRERPSLVLGQHEDMAVVRACIDEVDDRTWDLSQWRLVENIDSTPRVTIDQREPGMSRRIRLDGFSMLVVPEDRHRAADALADALRDERGIRGQWERKS